ncbi:MAG: TlpA family protein disulfide reductase [Persicimonas sp.]
MLEYRYPHFKRELLMEDMSFGGGPSPGEPMPDFELPTTDGDTIRKSDFVGDRPLLLTVGSITCPMTAASGKILHKLHREFGDQVAFVTLYVREAHPGDAIPQAKTLDDKLAYARAYKERDGIHWKVAVDDVEGTLHRKLDPKPNSTYIMSEDGTVAYRSLWSNDERALRKGLRGIVEGKRVIGETESHAVPMVSGMGKMYEMLEMSGPTAKKDLMNQAPPMYAMARLASMFRPLSPLGRGMTAMALGGLGLFALGRGIKRLRES